MNSESESYHVGLLPIRWLHLEGSEEPRLCRGGRCDVDDVDDRRLRDEDAAVSGVEYPDLLEPPIPEREVEALLARVIVKALVTTVECDA